MSTKTLRWLVRAREGKKLGSCWDPVNSIPTLSQPCLFQSFAEESWCNESNAKNHKSLPSNVPQKIKKTSKKCKFPKKRPFLGHFGFFLKIFSQ